MLDLGLAVLIRDRRAVVLEQMIEIQAEAVPGRGDARIDDVETELIERGRGAGEAMAARAREDQRRGRAADAARIERHERLIGRRIGPAEEPSVPGALLRGVLQGPAGGEAGPAPAGVPP